MVKQDNNGTTFVISDIEIHGLTDVTARTAHAFRRPIGPWTRPTTHDTPTPLLPDTTAVLTRPDAEPPFQARPGRWAAAAQVGPKVSDIDQGDPLDRSGTARQRRVVLQLAGGIAVAVGGVSLGVRDVADWGAR